MVSRSLGRPWFVPGRSAYSNRQIYLSGTGYLAGPASEGL